MYKIEYTNRAAKDFVKLPQRIQKQIRDKLDILAHNPFTAAQVKALKGEDIAYRLRVGDYRVGYYIKNEKMVITIIRMGHRKDIYQ